MPESITATITPRPPSAWSALSPPPARGAWTPNCPATFHCTLRQLPPPPRPGSFGKYAVVAAIRQARSGGMPLGYGALSAWRPKHRAVRVCCVTGATGFVGGHVARLLSERGDRTRVTYRDQRRLERLHAIDVDPVRADMFDRGSMRRAMRGCEIVFHTAGDVGSRPLDRVWRMNALSPRLGVEAAAAEGGPPVGHTPSVA